MIDLSNNNSRSWLPLAYNFKKVKAYGQQRVYFKCTEGSRFVDRRTPALAKRAFKAGLKVGWYHFANDWGQAPRAQAEFFIRNMPKTYQVIPCLDMEQGAPSSSKGAWALAFCQRVEELTGDVCAIYGSTYYLSVCFRHFGIAKKHPLWIAAVSRTGGYLAYEHVQIPDPWMHDQVAFHQNNWHARVPGIPGECDWSKPIHPHLLDPASAV